MVAYDIDVAAVLYVIDSDSYSFCSTPEGEKNEHQSVCRCISERKDEEKSNKPNGNLLNGKLPQAVNQDV